MKPREPAGCERGRGKSAEFSVQAWAEGGVVGNTCGTVRGKNFPWLRYQLTENFLISLRHARKSWLNGKKELSAEERASADFFMLEYMR